MLARTVAGGMCRTLGSNLWGGVRTLFTCKIKDRERKRESGGSEGGSKSGSKMAQKGNRRNPRYF